MNNMKDLNEMTDEELVNVMFYYSNNESNSEEVKKNRISKNWFNI